MGDRPTRVSRKANLGANGAAKAERSDNAEGGLRAGAGGRI